MEFVFGELCDCFQLNLISYLSAEKILRYSFNHNKKNLKIGFVFLTITTNLHNQ